MSEIIENSAPPNLPLLFFSLSPLYSLTISVSQSPKKLETFFLHSFNQLDLPVYETYDKLRHYLLKAIHECSEGFGFA